MDEPLLSPEEPILSVVVARLTDSDSTGTNGSINGGGGAAASASQGNHHANVATIVAEYDATDKEFQTTDEASPTRVTSAMLRRLPTQDTELIMTLTDRIEFRFMNRDEILVGVVCNTQEFRVEVSRHFMREIHAIIQEKYYDRVKQAVNNSLKRELKPVLRDLTRKYSNVRSVDKFKQVNEKVAEVQDDVTAAIEKTLARGEKIDTLEEKTNTLSEDANKFKKNARKARALMMCKNIKMMTILSAVLVIVAGLIMGFVCHWNIASCSKYV
eukprot:gb/GECG01009666.1/.p1 GENE.gb/GECG01009666.1/~~gb/GECG01009666.1/.p1  ORF type:complete len:271 (+),score=40.59 gb/GECG01009666.1/:1-813(+)